MDTATVPVKAGRERASASHFPAARPRRLRLNPQLRAMVRETQLAPEDRKSVV